MKKFQHCQPEKDKIIQYWLFDLDNTLYPASSNLFNQIERRIGTFVAQYLNISGQKAKLEQKRLFHRYGSTLRGLMDEHQVKPIRFLEYVHDIDYSVLEPCKKLKLALRNLPGRKLIYTNGSNQHATNILKRLGVENYVEAIFDIVDAEYLPKPDPRPLSKLLKVHHILPEQSLFAEDMVKNLEPAALLGMTTLWVETNNMWASRGNMNHVHYKTDNLANWLYLFYLELSKN